MAFKSSIHALATGMIFGAAHAPGLQGAIFEMERDAEGDYNNFFHMTFGSIRLRVTVEQVDEEEAKRHRLRIDEVLKRTQ